MQKWGRSSYPTTLSNQPILTTEDTQNEVVHRLAQLMLDAQIKISRLYRRYRLRKLASGGQYSTELFIGENVNPTDQVFIQGEFGVHSSLNNIEMKYSHLHRAFKVQLTLVANAKFRFLVNGRYQLSSIYQVTPSNKDNIFTLSTNTSKKEYHYHKMRTMMPQTRRKVLDGSSLLTLALSNKSYKSRIHLSKAISHSEISNSKLKMTNLGKKIVHPKSNVYWSPASKGNANKQFMNNSVAKSGGAKRKIKK